MVVLRDTLANGAGQYTNGDTIDFDGLMLSEQANVETYFDGDTADAAGYAYSWRDEPGKSISLRNYDSTPIVEPDSAIWNPGQSAWDFIAPLVQRGQRRFFSDEARVWRLVSDSYAVAGTAIMTEGVNLTSATEALDRSEDTWFDACVVEYRWTDEAGLSLTAYDAHAPAGFTKVQNFRYDTAYPGPGAAQALVTRALTRGRVVNVEAVNDYAVEPNKAIQITLAGLPTQTGTVSAITWNTPENEMTVTSRGLTG